jgi:hypothetical protein
MTENNRAEHWSELYRQALFEEDRGKLPGLLEVAHKAATERVHQLWYGAPANGDSLKERRELDAALYYLGLLRKLDRETRPGELLF